MGLVALRALSMLSLEDQERCWPVLFGGRVGERRRRYTGPTD
jgi:hypothetical protein